VWVAMPRVIADAPIIEKHARCEHCGKLIAYVNNDVQERHGTDYGGGPDGAKWVVCPGCGKSIILESW
jgi:ribosomal protein S27AE